MKTAVALWIKGVIGSRFVLWTIMVIAIAEIIVIVVLTLILNIPPQSRFGIAALTVPVPFIVGLMQLGRTIRVQRASFIKDYVSQFFTHDKLYETYYNLIYTYEDSIFENVQEILTSKVAKNKQKPVFDCLVDLNNGRPEGSRLYHPDFFQGSLEERRLDMLLGYLDVIGFYYCRGFLKMEDIAGSLGYYLSIIGQRHVIKRYFQICANSDYWSPESTMGATEPFGYLRRLLTDFEEYNRAHSARLRKLQQDLMFR